MSLKDKQHLVTKSQYATLCGVSIHTIYARINNCTGGLRLIIKPYGEFIDTVMFPPHRKRVLGAGRKKNVDK